MTDLRELLENLIRDRAKEYLTTEDIKAICSAYADVCAGYAELKRVESWGKWAAYNYVKEGEQS